MTPFERRTRRAQERLADGEGLVLSPGPDLYHLSGFWEEPSERPLLFVLGPAGDPAMVVPELYAGQVRTETWVEDVRTYADEDDPMRRVAAVVRDRGIAERLFVEPTMQARLLQSLRETFPTAGVLLGEERLEALRVRKDEAELDALRRAGRVADEVSKAVRGLGPEAVGRTEAELAAGVADRLAARGGSGVSFPVIVGSGPNGAHPHHTHGDREVEAGDPVVLDFGTCVDRYVSDQTRTVVFDGEPPEGFRAAHEAVRDAQAAAVAAVEPGATTGAVDAAARSVLEERGYGDAFVHRTGHGVGLSVHEAPYVVAGGDRVLEPGMVFSVEPGIYLEGEYGIRIEDLVVVTEGGDGVERLNDTPRGWRPDGSS